jgi:hypothetical protein
MQNLKKKYANTGVLNQYISALKSMVIVPQLTDLEVNIVICTVHNIRLAAESEPHTSKN